jgi:hypothetical protein
MTVVDSRLARSIASAGLADLLGTFSVSTDLADAKGRGARIKNSVALTHQGRIETHVRNSVTTPSYDPVRRQAPQPA